MQIDMRRFTDLFFEDKGIADHAEEICLAILSARSLRLTEISAKMRCTSSAAYKRIQRFLKKADTRHVLRRLMEDIADFVIAETTEIEHPQARKTEYVGTLKDGKTCVDAGMNRINTSTHLRILPLSSSLS